MPGRNRKRTTEGEPRREGDGRSSGAPGETLFRDAMRGVEPIAPHPQIPRARRPPGREAPAAPAEPVRFEIEQWGERIEGRIRGFDRRRLARLRRGGVPPEVTVDLHGALEAEARAVVHQTLLEARRTGARIVLVVHGRGLHSPEGPVLKTALPGWLAEPPVGASVLAFVSAPPALGGPGATLVLLRRRTRASGRS